jgi:hypothetical protein
MAVAITCTGRLGMGFKISPRAIGFSAGLQLPFSIILALRSRAESRNNQSPPEPPPAGFFVASFAGAEGSSRKCRFQLAAPF